ncbi:MAG TPA: OmpA family protein, partial [Flavobacteriales bacterium]|nr:OmpA family protein [Flavobacteriales bacterium]
NMEYEIGFTNDKFINQTVKINLPGDENATISFVKDMVVDRKEKLIFAKPELFQVNNILFKLASAQLEISDKSKKQLDAVIKQLETAPGFKIRIAGHTDDRGKEKYNLELSLKRANFIAEYVESKGISSDNLVVEGYGSDRPLASNSTEDGRSKNRRVEVTLFEN